MDLAWIVIHELELCPDGSNYDKGSDSTGNIRNYMVRGMLKDTSKVPGVVIPIEGATLDLTQIERTGTAKGAVFGTNGATALNTWELFGDLVCILDQLSVIESPGLVTPKAEEHLHPLVLIKEPELDGFDDREMLVHDIQCNFPN